MINEAIARGDIAAANVLVAEKHIETVRSLATAANQWVAVVTIEAAGLAGVLGGIAEIARATFDPTADTQKSARVPDTGPCAVR